MSRWIKVVAVALAAVVGLVPAFAQLSYAQAVPQAAPVLPVGEVLPDGELLAVDGEVAGWVILVWWLFKVAVAGIIAYEVVTLWQGCTGRGAEYDPMPY